MHVEVKTIIQMISKQAKDCQQQKYLLSLLLNKTMPILILLKNDISFGIFESSRAKTTSLNCKDFVQSMLHNFLMRRAKYDAITLRPNFLETSN